jgi:deoxyribose-phosphate aldolase
MNKIQIMFDTIQNAGSNMQIKASGGVRTAEQINSMLGMVNRFGMGYAAVDKLNNLSTDTNSAY